MSLGKLVKHRKVWLRSPIEQVKGSRKLYRRQEEQRELDALLKDCYPDLEDQYHESN